jgi:hypothetical protein
MKDHNLAECQLVWGKGGDACGVVLAGDIGRTRREECPIDIGISGAIGDSVAGAVSEGGSGQRLLAGLWTAPGPGIDLDCVGAFLAGDHVVVNEVAELVGLNGIPAWFPAAVPFDDGAIRLGNRDVQEGVGSEAGARYDHRLEGLVV